MLEMQSLLFQVLQKELYRNLALAAACVFIVTLLLIANLWTSILVFTCVAFTVVCIYQKPFSHFLSYLLPVWGHGHTKSLNVNHCSLVQIWAMSWENLSSEVCDHVRLKPACSGTEANCSLEFGGIATINVVLSRQRTTKALIWAFVVCILHKTGFLMMWLMMRLICRQSLLQGSGCLSSVVDFLQVLRFLPSHKTIILNICVLEKMVLRPLSLGYAHI